MLYPSNYQYLVDLLSYVAVGARSVENQEHRLVSSGISVPVGMKNPTAGSTLLCSTPSTPRRHIRALSSAIGRLNATAIRSRTPLCVAISVSMGAPTQLPLRAPGAPGRALYRACRYANPAAVIDCNHDNSGKRPLEQYRICKEVLDSCRRNESISKLVKGFMIESYLEDGNQPVDGGVFGKSITDPCLGWEKTDYLIHEIAERI